MTTPATLKSSTIDHSSWRNPAPIYSDYTIPGWLDLYLKTNQSHSYHHDLADHPTGLETLGSSSKNELGPRSYSVQDIDLICRSFQFAYYLHQGQKRKSGEPYIAHPVSVAELLKDLGGDATTIAAGFLHDVVEDTEITPEELEAEFGSDVRCLVEGVTKLSKFNFSSKTEQQAENFRRMFLAMAKDIRVIVVKLADRLHNMRTLEFLAPEKQKAIAAETMEIFAPLANRLGIWHFKWELEDLSFKYLSREDYRHIQELVSIKRTERETEIERFIQLLSNHLKKTGLDSFEISGRPKHLYSIFKKMQSQHKEFHEIYDLSAVRVIVKNNGDCYKVLSVVHGNFRPIPGRFKDYIGLPKPNRYQSLHTSVIGLEGRPVEVQIRTEEMHHIAEYGIAAHWKYKESGSTALKNDEEKFSWLRQLLGQLMEWQKDLKDDTEYMDAIRENLFESEVYIFTPKGDLLALPKGSCPIDFAYRIHSEIGDHCSGSKVNNRMVPLETKLRNGDIVQIITHKNAHPSLDWISFVATSSARNRIRQWFKRSHREQHIQRGRQQLERELGKAGLEALLKSDRMRKIAEHLNYTHSEDLLAALGHGEATVASVVKRLRDESKIEVPDLLPLPSSRTPSPGKQQSTILGIEGLYYQLAKCCNPLPGDPIIGSVRLLNRGLSVHHQNCPNITQVPGDRLVPISWNEEVLQNPTHTYPVTLQLDVIDRVGVLKDVLMRVSDQDINVRHAQVRTFANRTATIDLCLDINHKHQLNQITNRLRQMSDVLSLRSAHQMGISS